MVKRKLPLVAVLAALAVMGTVLFAQGDGDNGAMPGVAAHLIVTAEAVHGKQVPELRRDDIVVRQGHDRLQVTEFLPLQGEHAGLELFILVDDAASNFGTYLPELRQFINSQPPSTAIGVGYMREGMVMIAQNLTTDHAAAAKSVRLPLGTAGAGGSPYLSLSDLIKRWPQSNERHEVVMLTNGVDPIGGSGPLNPYLDTAIEDAQRSGVLVYSIYIAGVGHFGHSYWRMNWGQNYLSELAEMTGAESYFIGFGSPVAITPYLQDMVQHINHQYAVTFLAKPEKKNAFVSVKVSTEVPDVQLIAPTRVYVPAGK